MLMGDAGTRLRELVEAERELTRWLEILPLYAGVQVDLTPAADELVAFGVPDLRLETLPAQVEALLDEVAGAGGRCPEQAGRRPAGDRAS